MSERITLFLPIDLKLVLQDECAKNKQLSAQRVLLILTEHFKDELPKEVYEELRNRYSLTAQESKHIKELRAQERGTRKDARLRVQIRHIDERIQKLKDAIANGQDTRGYLKSHTLPKAEKERELLEAQLTPSTEPRATKSGKRK